MDANFEVTCDPSAFQAVSDTLAGAKIEPEMKEISRLPKSTVDLDVEAARKVLKLMERLDDHDDVQNVSANFNIPQEGRWRKSAKVRRDGTTREPAARYYRGDLLHSLVLDLRPVVVEVAGEMGVVVAVVAFDAHVQFDRCFGQSHRLAQLIALDQVLACLGRDVPTTGAVTILAAVACQLRRLARLKKAGGKGIEFLRTPAGRMAAEAFRIM